jgi:hypothetical protein
VYRPRTVAIVLTDAKLPDWIDAHPKETAAFMKAVKRGTDYMFADPVVAWAKYCEFKASIMSLEKKCKLLLTKTGVPLFTASLR